MSGQEEEEAAVGAGGSVSTVSVVRIADFINTLVANRRSDN